MNKLKKEYLFFKQQEPNMRTLLVTNMALCIGTTDSRNLCGSLYHEEHERSGDGCFLSAGNVYRHHYYLSC